MGPTLGRGIPPIQPGAICKAFFVFYGGVNDKRILQGM